MPLYHRAKRIASIIAFPAIVVAVATVGVAFRAELFGLFKSAESIRSWTQTRGAFAPLAFMGLQMLQVIVFVIPGEVVQLAGGFAFGFWGGTFWSVLGILAGSLVNFGIGRALGRPFVLAVFGEERMKKVDAATAGGKAAAGFFLLFVIPGIPKDMLTYVAGASRLSFVSFMLVSTIGRLPGIVGSSYMGSAVFDKQYGAAIIVVTIASILFVIGLAFRDRLHDLVARAITRRKPK